MARVKKARRKIKKFKESFIKINEQNKSSDEILNNLDNLIKQIINLK